MFECNTAPLSCFELFGAWYMHCAQVKQKHRLEMMRHAETEAKERMCLVKAAALLVNS